MNRRYRYDGTTGEMVEITKAPETASERPTGPQVLPDLPEYVSPTTGALVSGRAARREDLKRSGCRPYENGERQAWQAQLDASDAALSRGIARTVEKFFYETLDARGRDALVREMRGGADVQTVRRSVK